MKPSDIREELLQQHAGLRGHLDAARLEAERWARGERSREDVHAELAELAEALRVHHVREERALGALIRSVQEELMDDEHVREHGEMLDALGRVGRAADAREGSRELQSFCSNVLAHMSWEERAFFNERLLPDDER
jgi:uncharacterized protein YicC (UPF0701 family)